MKPYILEACVDSVESATIATNAGANRLELCSNLMIGGTTPSAAFFNQVRKCCNNKINVLIRPRFGDFLYTDNEFEIILNEVIQFKKLGADGVVVGILTAEGDIDTERIKQLVIAADGMHLTFHRAFDVCKNAFSALETIIDLGFNSILTSGQKNSCVDGADCIKKLVEKSNGRIDILVGSGVDSTVIEQLVPITNAKSYHMSGKCVLNSQMQFKNADVHMGIDNISEYDIWQTDGQKIKASVLVLDKCFNYTNQF